MATMHTNVIITNKFIAALEQDRIPWEKGWVLTPRMFTGNGVTKRPYSLLNRMLVSHPGKYYTSKQLQEKNAEMVKECPKHLLDTDINGTTITQEYWESLPDYGESKWQRSKFSLLHDMVTFWKIDEKETGKIKDDGTPEKKKTFLLRYYYVVWEGYTNLYEGEPEEMPKAPRFDEGDALMKFYTAREGIKLIEEEGSEAFYRPFDDSIHLPAMEQFKVMEEFYSTAFHEMTHSTGIEKRLNREMGGMFGSKSYAREELVAEIGASFLTNYFGIRTDKVERNNTAYIQSWIQRLKKDPDLIIKAATKAEKAMDFILDGFEEPTEPQNTPEEPQEPTEKPKGKKKGGKKMPKTTTAQPKNEGAKKRRSSLEAFAEKLRNTKNGSVTYLDDNRVAVTDHFSLIITDRSNLPLPEQNPMRVETVKNIMEKLDTDASQNVPDKLIPLIKMRIKDAGVKRAVPLLKLLNGGMVDARKIEPALKAIGNNTIYFNSTKPLKPLALHDGNWETIIVVCPFHTNNPVWFDDCLGGYAVMKGAR